MFPTAASVAIIGPNGAGKTTLLNVINGLVRPDKGRCYLDQYELTCLPSYDIARLGIGRTFQEVRVVSELTVLENVLLAFRQQRGEHLLNSLFRIGVAAEEKQNRTFAMRWLQFVGLEGIINELAGQLSYGQQKLLALACCLALDATILLLDEPVAGVHPAMADKILDLLAQIRDTGKQIVFVEHDIASVRRFADLLLVMDAGKIIAYGDPKQVLEMPHIIEAYVG
jgi:ABC-type branched-subunit amino acid transport system ATPase component